MSSREDITALHALGWTNAAIGRAVGRDSSLIHQIATGKKPGANLAPTLDALRASGLTGPKTARQVPNVRLPEAPRRTRASGQPARVREGRQEREARGSTPPAAPRGHGEHLRHARKLPNGQVYLHADSKRGGRLAADIADSYRGKHNMKMSYKGVDGKWHSVGAHGFSADLWRDMLARSGSFADAIAALLVTLRYHGAAPTGEAEFYIVTQGVDKRA